MVRRVLALVTVVAALLGAAGAAYAQPTVETDPQSDDATPPRLSYAEGSVSFWRPGGDDWAPAQVNTPLAAGDQLYTGRDGNLELQIGGRAFVRAWGDTQVGLTNQDPNFVQLRVSAGHLALDLRSLDSGDVVEIDTPAAAFTVDQPGYYRVDVTADRTSFVTRRAGRATMTMAAGPAGIVQPGEAVVLAGTPTPSVQRFAAPELDVWDRWNDTRTDALLAAVSTRYVPPQVYGVNELDRYGTWRTEPTYGSVWVPASLTTGWVPYSSGRWIWDPRFGWTWLDTAPWGWAPYHYGRWVSLGGVWAWAPGPIVVRPVYAPALVAFFGVPGVTVGVASPASVGWCALGWGEPLVPWWGRPGFVGRPYWAGWGGPRVREITVHRNVTVANAVVVVRSDHFGRRPVQETRIARPDVRRLQPVHGRLAVKPEPVSFTPGRGHAVRPPDTEVSRSVVSKRPPAPHVEPPRAKDDRHDARDLRPDAAREQPPSGKGDARPGGPRPDARRDLDGRRDGRPDARPARPDKPGPAVEAPTPKTAPRAPATPPVVPQHPPTVGGGNGILQSPPPRVGAPRPEIRRPEPPRVEPPRSEPQRSEPPRTEQPRNQPPRAEPGRNDAPRSEAPRVEPRRVEPPRAEPPRVEMRRPEPPRAEAPRVEMRRSEPPRVEVPRVEAPRRAAAHGADNGRRPEPARVVTPQRRAEPPAGTRHGRPGTPTQNERARQER
jgi:Family of unknown function (DUF6600)